MATAFASGAAFCGLASDSVNVLVLSPDKLKTTRESLASAAPIPKPPVATTAIYCCPLASAYVIGVDSAEAGSFTVHNSVAGSSIEGAKASIVGSADEREAAGGDDGAAQARPPGVLLPWRQAVCYSQSSSPRDLAGVHVDRDQLAPRRWGAGQVIAGVPETNVPASGPELE